MKFFISMKWGLIVSNPPYSIKNKFLKRAYQLGKPFMFLLPITTLEGVERNEMFRRNKIQLLIPDKRFEFSPEKKRGAWFQTSWFTWGLGLEKELNFIPLKGETLSSADRYYTFTSILDFYKEVCPAA
jgi:hypothetical protein